MQFLHTDRSTGRYGNTLFSSLAVDLCDKHVKSAYPQAQKSPVFVLGYKHTLQADHAIEKGVKTHMYA